MPKVVMVVDDEPDIRDTVKDVLVDAGLKVVTAKDGQDCVDKVRTSPPDLILLDILMPGLTTKEVIARLNKVKSPPIIFLTVVKLSEATKKNIIQGNMVDYVEKPFNNADLVKRVKKALGM